MLDVFILIFCFFSLTYATCPTGSTPFFSDKTRCLYFQQNKTYYLDAEQACMDLGGHLTSVHTLVDNMYLSQQALNKFTDSDFWFGLNDLYSPQKWTWMDNTTFDFENWDKGQPQNASGNDCGAVLMHGGRWKADDCFTQKPYVCVIAALDIPTTIAITANPTTSKPEICPDSWTFYNTTGYCYRVFDYKANWLEAEDRCKIDKAHLVSIHSLDENNFVTELATFPHTLCDGTQEPWIGFYTEDDNLNWKWTDNTPFDYSNWSYDEPNKPGQENCCQIFLASQCWTPGKFNNFYCDSKIPKFICKRLP